MLRGVTTTLFVLNSLVANAQFTDSFADGDFTASPAWTGETQKFEIIGQRLHLNDATASGTASLSTPSEAVADATWEATVEIAANPSASNYARFYLMADQADLSGELNGYFVRIGGSEDDVSLYRQDGTSITKIIDGTDNRVDVDPVQITLRVTRDASGNWQLFSKPNGAPAFISEGAGSDEAHEVSTHSGIYCQYTSTRKEAFYFDDFSVTGTPQPDDTPIAIETHSVLSATQLQLTWSEDATFASAQRAENYALSNRAIATAQTPDARTAVLSWNDPLVNGAQSVLTVRGVADEAGNTIKDTTLWFHYFVEVAAQWQDVVINEIMPDPNPVVTTLPDAEFIELYNRSAHPFQLQGWTLNDKALPERLLLPNEYVLLSVTASASAFAAYGEAQGVSSWPALSNGGGEIILKDAKGQAIDALRYAETDIIGGYSIERIQVDPPCDGRSNHETTPSAAGGTPGAQNASFSNQPDTQPPVLFRVTASAPREVRLHFDEAVALANLRVALSPVLGISQMASDPTDERIVLLQLTKDLIAGSLYKVTADDATDCYGNQAEPLTAFFTYDNLAPALLRVAVRDTAALVLVFDEKLASAGDKEYYVVNNDIGEARAVELLSDSSSVLLAFSISLDNGLVNQLRMAGATDRVGNVADTLVQDFKFRNDIDSVWTVSAYQVNVAFTTAPAAASVEQSQNYLLDRRLGIPNVAVQLSDKEVQLIYDRPLEANKAYELQINNLQTSDGVWLSTPIYRFAYDQKAPTLDSVVAVNDRTLTAYFSEAMQWKNTDSPTAFTVDQRIGAPEQVTLLVDGRSFRLSLSQDLQMETTYELSVVGLSDRAGNMISSSKKKNFLYDQQPPRLQRWQILAPNQLRLYFHEELQAASAGPPVHYTFDTDEYPDSVAVSHLHPGQITLFFTQSLPDQATLRINEVADVYGNKLNDPIEVVINNQAPALGVVVPLSATELRLDFTRTVDAVVMKNLDNYRTGDEAPTQAAVTGTYQSSVILTLNLPLTPNQTYSLTIKRLIDASGAVVENIETGIVYDTKVTNIVPEGSALTVEFSVPVDSALATSPLHYEVPEVGSPLVAVLTGPQTVRLVFASPFMPQAVHTLTIQGLLDQDREIIPVSQHPFGQGVAPAYNQLLITEVMADPLPAVGLPEVEYVELFNASDQLLSTQGLRFSDASTTVVLPTTFLAPQAYVLLVDEANRDALSPFGRIIAVKSLPSLNSSGDSLRLTNEQGQEIFALAYADDWYNDAQKRGGGWSLEMVDTQRPCGERDNWTASVDPTGGTPGRPNSVQQPNPDRFGPEVVRAFAVSDTLVHVLFSERLDKGSTMSAKITLSDGLPVRSVSWLEKKAVIMVDQPMQTGKTYSVEVQGVTDCSGNLIGEGQATTTFVLPEAAVPGDILLSELLFHSRSGGEKFVELYNHSSKPIDLKGWSLANLSGDSLFNINSVSDDHYVLAAGAYAALTENPTTLKADHPAASEAYLQKVAALPSLPADQGTVVLLDPAQLEMQRLDYSSDFHHPLLVDKQGVSLERIAWDSPVNDAASWQSAAQTASYATPGYRNSQLASSIASTASLVVDPPVFAPGHAGHADFTRIQYRFAATGAVANVAVYDAQGRKVRDLARNLTLAEEGFLVWDGTNDNHRRVGIGYYLIFFETFDTQGQVTVLKEKVVVAGDW